MASSRFGNLLDGSAPRETASSPSRFTAAAAVPPVTPIPVALIEVAGYMESVRVYGDWGIGFIWTEDRESIKVTGEAVKDLKEGDHYILAGRMKAHPKHGESLDVLTATPHVKLDARAIAKYLEKNFDGIGPKSAEKMVKFAMLSGGMDGLEKLRQQVLNEPWAIDWTPAQREGVFSTAQDETVHGFIYRDLTTRLGGVTGLHAGVIKALSKWAATQISGASPSGAGGNVVQQAWHIISSNPYAAIKPIPGFGFTLADTIGKMVNIPVDSPQRLGALVAHALSRGCDMEGHVFLTTPQIVNAIQQVDRSVKPDVAIKFGLDEGSIVLELVNGQDRYYMPTLLEAENSVAAAIYEMMASKAPLLTDVKGLEDKIQAAFRQGKPDAAKIGLDPSQVAAVRSVLTSGSRVHLITGGPGCGKTALVETIVKMLPGRRFHFAAPTGKAAKVLTNRLHMLGNTAATLHSTLGSGEDGFQINKENPLNGDVLVVDEGSMPPLEMYQAIVEGLNSDMHLILVGDPNQLQSIQPGRVLADLISIPGVNHSHLTEVHRNDGGILKVVKQVEHGECLLEDHYPDVHFSHELGEPAEYFPVVMKSYLDAVTSNGIENVVLVMSRRQGDPSVPSWTTSYSNAVLREVMNPNAEKLPGSASLHVGDRIIIRENMAIEQKKDKDTDPDSTVRVVNGDTGQIQSYELQPAGKKEKGVAWLRLKLDDGRLIDYPGSAMKALDHSYALTVHAVQGSEYRHVIVVATPGTPSFINRSSLFTALSRPRLKLEIHGEDQVIRKIAATPVPRRNSGLVEKVVERMRELEQEALAPVPSRRPRFAC